MNSFILNNALRVFGNAYVLTVFIEGVCDLIGIDLPNDDYDYVINYYKRKTDLTILKPTDMFHPCYRVSTDLNWYLERGYYKNACDSIVRRLIAIRNNENPKQIAELLNSYAQVLSYKLDTPRSHYIERISRELAEKL